MPKVTEEHKENMRHKIRESAKKLFLQKGFRAVTMKDIVGASGLSFGAVYSYYSNTSDIFLVLKQEEISADSLDYRLMLVAKTKEQFISQFITLLKKRLRSLHQTLIPATYDYLSFIEKGSHHTAITEIVYKQLEQQINDILNQAQVAKIIATDDTAKIASFLLVYVEGLYFQQAFIDQPSTQMALDSLEFALDKLI